MSEHKKKMEKKLIHVVFLIILLFSISPVFAITGSIGNARMVLRVETGETIERSILVKNTNTEAIDIEVFPSGDLEENVKIFDDKFTLQAGQEKKAYFEIKSNKKGTFETSINVRFTPLEGGNGVGLSSTVVLIVGGEDIENNIRTDDGKGVNVGTGNVISNQESDDKNDFPLSLTLVLLGITIFFILLIALLIVMLKVKKRQIKSKKKVKKSE